MNKNKFGFTLIETLMVVLIIGVLSAVAVPQYRRAVQKGESMEAMSMLRVIYDSSERLSAEYGFKSFFGSGGLCAKSTLDLNRLDMFNSSTLPRHCTMKSHRLMQCKKFDYEIPEACDKITAKQRNGSFAGTKLTFDPVDQKITCSAPEGSKACDVYGF